MARLWSSGFELNTITSGEEFGTAGGTIQTTVVRSGTYAGRITSLSSGAPKQFSQNFASVNSNGPFFFRAYFRVATLPTAENTIISLENSTGAGVLIVYITLDETGVLRLRDEDGVIGSPSSVLSLGTWYRIELQYDRTGASGSHIVNARLDGTQFAGSSTRSLSTGVYRIGFLMTLQQMIIRGLFKILIPVLEKSYTCDPVLRVMLIHLLLRQVVRQGQEITLLVLMK